MCSTGWGLQGHSCPITPWFISLLQLACMRRLFCCVGCYLQPERQAVCISGYTSVGCVWGNEMALLVMYLPSPFAEAHLWIHLVISPFYQDAFTDKRNERVTADPSRWLFYIFSPQLLDNRGWRVLSLCLQIPFWQILLIFFLPLLYFFFRFLTPSTFLLLVHHVQIQMDICRSKKPNKWN